MKKALSITLAALTAASTCICAYADNNASTENKTVLAMVKSRVSVPEELSEFTYSKNINGPVNSYTYTWTSPDGLEDYSSLSVCAYGNIITSYDIYCNNRWEYNENGSLAKMSGDELYAAALEKIKQLNPTAYTTIKVDRDSLNMSLYRNTATFRIYRVKNGIPVTSDTGSITLNKNTGELYRFNINWHPKASFQKPDSVISAEEAEKAYADMIAIKPVYVLKYDPETDSYSTGIEYTQTDYGDINAFTGEKSDFDADAYYDDNMFDEETCEADDAGNPETGFTPKELEELNKELPYGNAEEVVELVKSNKYLTWDDELTVSSDYLSKTDNGNSTRYLYSVYFSNESEFYSSSSKELVFMSVQLDAETGELLYYNFSDGNYDPKIMNYDLEKADKLADKILKSLSPKHYKVYESTESSVSEFNRYVYGSSHYYARTVNGIESEFDTACITFDKDMRLTNYSISYTDVKYVSPKTMLSEEQIMEKYYENSPLELTYLVKTGKTKTASVLVYTEDDYLRYDAFTGEPVYNRNYSAGDNDLSGITDSALLKKAKVLDDNGVLISTEKISPTDTVTDGDFTRMVNYLVSGSRFYVDELAVLPSGQQLDTETKLTRADAMYLYTSIMAGDKVAQLKGIFKSPFTDVPDTDPNIGYYAIAYALGAAGGTTLDPTSPYTYADVINLVYDSLCK